VSSPSTPTTDDQPCPAVAGVVLDVSGIELGQIAVEVAGLGLLLCPWIFGHRLVSGTFAGVCRCLCHAVLP
jgi:hypothetical protein